MTLLALGANEFGRGASAVPGLPRAAAETASPAATGSAIVSENEGSYSRQRSNTTGEVVYLTNHGQLRAKRAIRIVSVQPKFVSPQLDVLEARVLRIWQASTQSGSNRQPHGICTANWPPQGYGPTDHPIGFELGANDLFAILFYTRGDARRPGDHVVQGVTIEYEDGAARRTQTFDHYTMHLYVRASEAEFPAGPWSACTPKPYPWFGDV